MMPLYDLTHLFTPETMPLYRAVEARILSLTAATIEVKKTQVSFGSRLKFAWVWPPLRRMKKRPDHYVVLTLALGRKIDSPRVLEVVEPYPGRWTHHILIQSPSDLDPEMEFLIREAIDFAESRANKRFAKRL